MIKELAIKAGLTPAGQNDRGEQEYIGTRQQWDEYDRLEQTALSDHDCRGQECSVCAEVWSDTPEPEPSDD